MERAIFEKPSDQAYFLRTVKERLGYTWWETGKLCGYDESTVKNWAYDRYRMPADVVVLLSCWSGVTPPPYQVASEKELWRYETGKAIQELDAEQLSSGAQISQSLHLFARGDVPDAGGAWLQPHKERGVALCIAWPA